MQPGEVLANKYRIERALSDELAVALHLEQPRRVVIRHLSATSALDPVAVTSLLCESRYLTRLRSPHTPRILDVGQLQRGGPYFVREHLEGEHLATRRAAGVLSVELAVLVILQACDALAEAHAAGIVHGALRPSQLFIFDGRTGPVTKLRDFAHAAWTATRASLRLDAVAAGGDAVSSCVAPEQRRGALASVTSDVWALGRILHDAVFEVGSGERAAHVDRAPLDRTPAAPAARAAPAESAAPPALAALTTPSAVPAAPAARAAPAESAAPPALAALTTPSAVPAALAAVLDRCLATVPEGRYATLSALAGELAPFTPSGASLAARVARRG